jgi:hypothetical protein
MANMCFNQVTFSGDKNNLEQLKLRIENQLQEAEENRPYGHQAEAILIHSGDECEDGYFFDVFIEMTDDGLEIQYESKWSPNVPDVALICKEFQVSAVHDYSESGSDVYGECKYNTDGTYTDTTIEQEFLDEIGYDHDCEMYTYRGETYESHDDIIDQEYIKWKQNQ